MAKLSELVPGVRVRAKDGVVDGCEGIVVNLPTAAYDCTVKMDEEIPYKTHSGKTNNQPGPYRWFYADGLDVIQKVDNRETMQTFASGATRSADGDKFDYEGFLSPLALRRYAEYLHSHRIQADGTPRPADNWQKGITLPSYMKSAYRHFMDWHTAHDGYPLAEGDIETAICAVIFNAMGYLHELEKAKLAKGEK